MANRSNRSFFLQGFTLVEVMVVVAIIGILASATVPNYLKYKARATQTEAKTSLTILHVAEQSFFAEYDTFTNCLIQIGGVPETIANAANNHITQGKSFYTVGFEGNGATCGPLANTSCLYYTYQNGVGNSMCNPAPFLYTESCSVANTADPHSDLVGCCDSNCPGASLLTVFGGGGGLFPQQRTFKGGAAGSIGGISGLWDQWTIDETKILRNTASGL